MAECCAKKDAVLQSLAERCAGQSEVIGRRAEKSPVLGDPRFHAILKEMGELHDKKQADYGQKGDPFANIRSSSNWGVPPWIGAMVRLNDKIQRLQAFAKNGTLANEGVEDSLIDLANYAVIALVLFRETTTEVGLAG